jgi:hypothetical protein
MWNLNETRPLSTDDTAPTWLNRDLLATATEMVAKHRLTGTQTYAAVVPDEGDGDFAAFTNTLRSDITGETVSSGHVLRADSEYSHRAATAAEVLGEMAHAAGFGDTTYVRMLRTLLGPDDAAIMALAGSLHL